jgi:hypothetical protein
MWGGVVYVGRWLSRMPMLCDIHFSFYPAWMDLVKLLQTSIHQAVGWQPIGVDHISHELTPGSALLSHDADTTHWCHPFFVRLPLISVPQLCQIQLVWWTMWNLPLTNPFLFNICSSLKKLNMDRLGQCLYQPRVQQNIVVETMTFEDFSCSLCVVSWILLLIIWLVHCCWFWLLIWLLTFIGMFCETANCYLPIVTQIIADG